MNTEQLNTAILTIVDETERKLTAPDLIKMVLKQSSAKRKAVKNAIRNMVAKGELAYTQQFGNTFIEKSFNRPARVSNRVVLVPEGASFCPAAGDIAVKMSHGAAFGTGAHPTTRLSIRCIETAMEYFPPERKDNSRMLDIGTGSGVLALVGLKMGIFRAIGLDIDPCARKEAMDNARLNRLEHRFSILREPLGNLNPPFCLIAANLRCPTLMNIGPQLARLVAPGGHVAMSGFRPSEFADISNEYTQLGFRLARQNTENNWSGALFEKR